MFGIKVPVLNKKGSPKINFEVLASGGFAVSVNMGKVRGRVSWSKKNGFNISGGGRVPNKKQNKE